MNELIEHDNLKVYNVSSKRILEDYGREQTVLAGGYAYRQILELVQNGADAIFEACESRDIQTEENRIDVLLKDNRLYVANTGAPLSKEGIDSLLRADTSPKRKNQIGRFGLGFKSLLRFGGKIDIFSTTESLRFDPVRCRQFLCEKFEVKEAPGLRLAWQLDEIDEKKQDLNLNDFSWATTIVRAEIAQDDDGTIQEHLRNEIRDFPCEFLLFLPVPVILHLEDGLNDKRELRREDKENGKFLLHDGNRESRWRVVTEIVNITNAKAKDDATDIHKRDSVPLSWAMPLDTNRDEKGRFWAFFPTHTPTFLAGILNAPWKLNSDRTAIIDGEWNNFLMREAARIIGEAISELAIPETPGRVLDAFPRQLDRIDEIAAPLVEALWCQLEEREIIPDATGVLRLARDLWRHPRQSHDIARQWNSLASVEKCKKLVHPSCLLNRERISRLNALAERLAKKTDENQPDPTSGK